MITVSFLRDCNHLSAAAACREEFGIKSVLGSAELPVQPTASLEDAVLQLINALEVDADIMIQNVACHHAGGSPEDSENLAAVLEEIGVEAVPIYVRFDDAIELASWWLDRQ